MDEVETVEVSSGRQQRMAFLAIVAVFVLGVVAIAAVSQSDRDRDGGLPKLPIGAGGGDAATMESRAADSSMIAPWGGVEYRVGDLPDLARSAPAHRIAPATAGDVAGIATALGLDGRTTENADEWIVKDGDRELHVQKRFGSSWWFNAISPDTAVSSSSGTRSSCACPEGADCDCPAPDAMPCEMPPCPEGEMCAQVCPPEQGFTPPARPADLPSQSEAREIAEPILDELGATIDKRVRVDDGFSSWIVSAPIEVGGVAVEGLMASVSIGPKGEIVGGNGLAGRVEAVGDYPLVAVLDGVERLRTGFPYAGPDCIGCEGSPGDDVKTLEGGGSTGSAGATEPGSDPDAARCAADGPDCMEPAPPTSPVANCPEGVDPCRDTGAAAMCAEGSVDCNDTPMPCPVPAPMAEEELRRLEEQKLQASQSAAAGTEPAIAPPPPGCVYPEPEPVVRTITGARLGLLFFNDYLVPAFVFSIDDGGEIPVIAVTKQNLAAASPNDIPVGRPEPALIRD